MFELRDGAKIVGQFSADQIKWLANNGRLLNSMEIRRLPSGDWKRITEVRDLQVVAPARGVADERAKRISTTGSPQRPVLEAVGESRIAEMASHHVLERAPESSADTKASPANIIAENIMPRCEAEVLAASGKPVIDDKQYKNFIRLSSLLVFLCFALYLQRLHSNAPVNPPESPSIPGASSPSGAPQGSTSLVDGNAPSTSEPSRSDSISLQGAAHSPQLYPVTKQDIAAAIEQMSEWSGISQDKIRSMSVSEQQELANRFMAQKLGRSPEEISRMPAQELFDEAIAGIARKYGIQYAEASRLADLQAKMDSGREITGEEVRFLLEMNKKLRRHQ